MQSKINWTRNIFSIYLDVVHPLVMGVQHPPVCVMVIGTKRKIHWISKMFLVWLFSYWVVQHIPKWDVLMKWLQHQRIGKSLSVCWNVLNLIHSFIHSLTRRRSPNDAIKFSWRFTFAEQLKHPPDSSFLIYSPFFLLFYLTNSHLITFIHFCLLLYRK